jgi:hypothetical protein
VSIVPAVAEPLSGSLLFRNLSIQFDLLEKSARELQAPLSDKKTTSLLEQMIRVCVAAPEMWRELWEWAQEQDQTGQIIDRPIAGKVLRDQLAYWMTLLSVMHDKVSACEQEGNRIRGTDELLTAADELGAIGREVNQTWPIEEIPPPNSSVGISYAELRKAGESFPAAGEWPDEEFSPP